MKIKQFPEDFIVEEELACPIQGQGPFALYRMTKQDIGTPEACRQLARSWKVPRRMISVGGRKDRHAQAIQYVTVEGKPRTSYKDSRFSLEHVGALGEAIKPAHIKGNRFTIVVRDLRPNQAAKLMEESSRVSKTGFPNYFGEQRFGSVRGDGEFIARRLVKGDVEGALRMVLAKPQPQDRGKKKDLKRLMHKFWGRWELALTQMPPCPERKIVEILAKNPSAWPQAFERLDKDMRNLWLEAWQAYLWNTTLSHWVADLTQESARVWVRIPGAKICFPFDGAAAWELAEIELPYLSPRKVEMPGPAQTIYDELLAEEGIALSNLKMRFFKETFFKKGSRPAWTKPLRMKVDGPHEDEHNPKRKTVRLSLFLDRGVYATTLLARLQAVKGMGGSESSPY